jgi:hypothetical protein
MPPGLSGQLLCFKQMNILLREGDGDTFPVE